MSVQPPTLAILGCGTLGTAILCGVLDALSTSTDVPALVPTHFTPLVTRASSASRIAALIPPALSSSVNVLTDSHAAAVTSASIVLLGCKPYLAAGILTTPAMAAALEGKLLISICAGVSLTTLQSLVPSSCRVVRVMPNTAARIRESMTVISPAPEVTDSEKEVVRWICKGIGETMVLDERYMDAATAICGSGPAFAALLLEAMVDGGVMVGVPRPQAEKMVAQAMLGAAKLVLDGQSPSVMREQICTPGGCTIAGLLRMEDGGVRSAMARTVQVATEVAGGLGAKKK